MIIEEVVCSKSNQSAKSILGWFYHTKSGLEHNKASGFGLDNVSRDCIWCAVRCGACPIIVSIGLPYQVLVDDGGVYMKHDEGNGI